MSAAEDFRRLVAEALERSGKGILAFEQDHGLKPSSIKAIVSPALNQTPSIEKAERIAKALGFEFYVGPPRHDGTRRYDGSFTYSGDPQPAPLSPALRQALRLDEDATELDALERIASLPHAAHRAMEMLQAEARRREALAGKLAAAQHLLAEALEELAASAPPGFAETPAPAFRDAPALHAGFAEPAPPAFQPRGRPDPSPDDEKD